MFVSEETYSNLSKSWDTDVEYCKIPWDTKISKKYWGNIFVFVWILLSDDFVDFLHASFRYRQDKCSSTVDFIIILSTNPDLQFGLENKVPPYGMLHHIL